MASTPRVVCWQNREEWLYVYRTLYNFDNPEAQRRGVDRVAAWKSRSVGKLPLAIESTANLISAHLGLADVGTVQGRLTLAMAIVRFVNGMVDQVQKGKFARSVQSVAEEIGLPDWLVDLRHEATHASLPSMDTLHCGLRASLSWLQGEYWEAQLKMHDDNMEKLVQLLNKYRDIALSHALRRNKMTKFKTNSKLLELSKEITSLVSMSNLWTLVPSLLSQTDMLACEQLNTTSIKWPKESSSSDSSISDVPMEIINMWNPLIEALDKSSSEFIASVVLHLLENHSLVPGNQTNDLSPGHADWVKHLLVMQSKGKPSLVLSNECIWVHVLKTALENPTLHSSTFIPLILENIPSINATLKEKIQHLVTIFIQPCPLECVNESEESQEVDLEDLMANRSKTYIEKPHQHNEPTQEWQVSQCSTQHWHLIPFGEVLGSAEISTNNLELSHL